MDIAEILIKFVGDKNHMLHGNIRIKIKISEFSDGGLISTS